LLAKRYLPTLCHDLRHEMLCDPEQFCRIRHYRAC
jgi:hypothetical protein